MTLLYPGDVDTTKGVWRRGTSDGKVTATVSCPSCGKAASISQHEIAPSGEVSPSLVCPYTCGFHDYVQLAEWRG